MYNLIVYFLYILCYKNILIVIGKSLWKIQLHHRRGCCCFGTLWQSD